MTFARGRMRFARLTLAMGLSCASCGYRAVHGAAPAEQFCVVLASSNVPDAVASDEVVAGVRDELARFGALRPGDAYPRVEIEVLRADETSEGIGATPNRDGVLLPDARATRVGILARGYLVRSKDGPHERDTGDVRASEVVSVASDARASVFRHADAARAASRRVGRRIGTTLLGFPASGD